MGGCCQKSGSDEGKNEIITMRHPNYNPPIPQSSVRRRDSKVKVNENKQDDEFAVKIKWLGNCEGCAMSVMTLRAGIEETLKNKIPEITSVEAVNGFVA